MFRTFILGIAFTCISANALVQKSTTVRPNARFMRADGNLFEGLDLKRKNYRFHNQDFSHCRASMTRVQETLHYNCKLGLPNKASLVKRFKMITPSILTVQYAGNYRRVMIVVDEEARTVTYSTEFDSAGVNLEDAKLNDDFYTIYAQAAFEVVKLAMKQGLRFETLESRDPRLASLRQ